jgi:hypothetical protein
VFKWCRNQCGGPVYRWMHRISNEHQYWCQIPPMGINIVIRVKFWYMMGMSRWENLGIPKLLFGSIPLYTSVILGWFFLPRLGGSLDWYIDPKWHRKQKHRQISYLTGIKQKWNPHSRHLNGVKKRHTRPALVGTPNLGEMKGRHLTLVLKVLSKVWQRVHFFYITVSWPKSNTSHSCGASTPLERSLKHSTMSKLTGAF